MIPARELKLHENAYHGFVRMIASSAVAVLVVALIVIGLISR